MTNICLTKDAFHSSYDSYNVTQCSYTTDIANSRMLTALRDG